MLEGRQSSIYTDHKPLVHAMAKTGELWSARQHIHFSAISEYTTDIQHVSGKNNVVLQSAYLAQLRPTPFP